MKLHRTHLGLGLFVLGFIFASFYVLRTTGPAARDDRTVIRIGHWLMHAGMREAFAEAIRRYEIENPHVHIEQIVVPIRSYRAWVRTQLVGGTAPDITGILGLDSQALTRYFLPLNDVILAPNPYHVGTHLDGEPWRDTFIDGLDSIRRLTAATGQVSGITLQLNTVRLYTNLELLHRVTGSRTPPADFSEFEALGAAVEAYNAHAARHVQTIAMCGPYLPYYNDRLLPTQTQTLAMELSPMRTLITSNFEEALLFATDRLSLDRPEFRQSLGLLRDTASLMPPGYAQLQRDDALFMFLQGNAVTFIAGSWDYGVLKRDGPFDVSVTRVPVPGPDHPRYGAFSRGPVSEAAINHEAAMGIMRHSPHPEIALDFLRFLTKPEIAQMFSDYSFRVSSVVGVNPPAGADELAPRLDGAVGGLSHGLSYFGGIFTGTLYERNLHLLTARDGDVESFVAAVTPRLPDTAAQDLRHFLRNEQREVERADGLIGIQWTRPDGPAELWRDTIEGQHAREAQRQDYLAQLAAAGR